VNDDRRRPEDLDVDVRFLLANERTLLAWLRTGLTLMAGGVALVQLSGARTGLQATGIGLLVLGAVAAVIGFWRYRTAGAAIRAGILPPPGHGPALITAGVAAAAAVIITIYLVT
jgi:putative membrane protein